MSGLGEVQGPTVQVLPGESEPLAIGGMMVSYSPVAMAQRAARFRSLLFRQWLGVAISLAISVVWWLIFSPELYSLLFWLLIFSVAWSLLRVLITIVKLRRARKTTSQVPLGPAFQIDNDGLVLSTVPEGERVGWPDVRLIKERHPGETLPVCYYLYSFEGALTDQHWDEIGEQRKRQLKGQIG